MSRAGLEGDQEQVSVVGREVLEVEVEVVRGAVRGGQFPHGHASHGVGVGAALTAAVARDRGERGREPSRGGQPQREERGFHGSK